MKLIKTFATALLLASAVASAQAPATSASGELQEDPRCACKTCNHDGCPDNRADDQRTVSDKNSAAGTKGTKAVKAVRQ